MNAAVVVENLTKWYGPRLAVDRVSFEIRRGEILGLLGPNGSGKTTILRLVTGYLRPTAGAVRIAGMDTVDAPLESRRRTGYVPEDVPLYDWMRVAEFLAFMARIKGVPPADAGSAVNDVVERLALRDVGRVPIGKLSRGYRQRVGIAQALLGRPELLVLDEPTNGLDPRQIIEVRELIRALGGHHTVLVTSHILSEIERIADRAAILLHGRLLGMQSLGAVRRLRVRVRGAAAGLRACLEATGGVTAVAVEPGDDGTSIGRAEVDGAFVAERLAAAIVAAGLGLVELSTPAHDLESVFLRLTGGNGTAGP
jgi:ABC-2 type transport system ATP-binding protein